MKNAFTLVEILVVISIMAVVGIILTEVFIRSLRGGNKAEVLAILKQNGQSVLENIDKNIRNSDNIICVDGPGDLLVIEKGGLYTRYRYVQGQLLEDHLTLASNVPQTQFLIDACANVNYADVAPAGLTDFEKVIVSSPPNSKIFTTLKSSGFKAIVTINFLLKPGGSIPKNVADQVDPVPFVTTIQVR